MTDGVSATFDNEWLISGDDIASQVRPRVFSETVWTSAYAVIMCFEYPLVHLIQKEKVVNILYGASPCLYSGTSFGDKVDGAPAMVRGFTVIGETSRSFVLRGDVKVSKKAMSLNTGSFEISMFASVDEAIASLRRP